MPLKNMFLPAGDDPPAPAAKFLLPGFICGCLFVLAPFPQLLCVRSGISVLLATSFISPLCGVGLMTALLICSGGREMLSLRIPDKTDVKYAFFGTCLIVAAYASADALWKLLLKSCGIPFSEEQQLMTLAKNLRGPDFLLFSLLVTIPVPVAEELLFRRILYALLRPAGRTFAIVFGAAVFSAVHLFPAGLPGLFIIGAGFQLLFLNRKNLAVSILGHAFLNACAVLSAAVAAP
ncbi:MAG: CPBP family intramembrane metalloprotease [Lentisphaeria bacterium]|nr:CPBP family intramembrane metalloprotease [Lentisphaeria bacterium]